MPDLTFKQAIIVAAVPSILAMSAAYFSHKAESNLAVVQARMMERDLIQEEALEKSRSGTVTYSYSIPVADNRAWGNYFDCREKKISRLECADQQRSVAAKLTPPIVKKGVDFGYES